MLILWTVIVGLSGSSEKWLMRTSFGLPFLSRMMCVSYFCLARDCNVIHGNGTLGANVVSSVISTGALGWLVLIKKVMVPCRVEKSGLGVPLGSFESSERGVSMTLTLGVLQLESSTRSAYRFPIGLDPFWIG